MTRKNRRGTMLWIMAGVTLALAACSGGADVQTRMSRAAEYRAEGEYRSAMIELKNVLQAQPENAEARLALGEVSLALGDPPAAEEQLDRAVKLGVEPAQTRLPMAKALLAQGKYQAVLDEIGVDGIEDRALKARLLAARGNAHLGLDAPKSAEQAFAEALSLEPGLPAALVGQARLATIRDDTETALARLDEALATDAGFGPAWMLKGTIAAHQSNYETAVAAFKKALEAPPDELSPQDQFMARGGLAEALLRQEHNKEALQYIETMLAQAPRHPYANYLRALLAYQEKEYDLAAEKLQVALSAAPGALNVQALLGAVQAAQGNLSQAEMYLGNVLAESPNNLSVRKMLASVLMRQGHPERAAAMLDPNSKAEQAQDPQLLAMLGSAALQMGDTSSGLSYLQQSVRADPEDAQTRLTFARALMQQGQNDRAIDVLEQMDRPERGADFEQERLLIVALLRQGNDDEAVAHVEKLLEAKPKDSVVRNLAGGVYMAVGRNDDARTQFEKATELAPDDTAAELNLGLLALREGRPDDAVGHLQGVVDNGVESLPAMLALARALDATGETDQALKWLEQARAADPEALEPRVVLIRYYLESGDAERARDIAQEAVAAAPDNASVLNMLGVAQFQSGQVETGIGTLEKAATASPETPGLQVNLARAQIAAGQQSAAIETLQALRQSHPRYLPADYLLAMTQLRAGQAKAAFATARSLEGKEDVNAGAAALLEGDLHMMRDEFEAAAQAYAAAIEKGQVRGAVGRALNARRQAGTAAPEKPVVDWLAAHPEDSEMRALLAQWYTEQEQYASAAEQYRTLLGKEGENPVALNNLAWVYYKQNDDRALKTARRALELAPDSPAILDTLGWIELQSGNVKRSVELLRQAVKLAPESADIRYHLAAALAKSGDKAAAREQLAQVLNGDTASNTRTEAERLAKKLDPQVQ